MLEEQLEELNIFALREYARRTGVASPTSKKKKELIKDIIAIKTGKKAPIDLKNNKGRPPKCYGLQIVDNANSLVLKQDTEDYDFSDCNIINFVGFVSNYGDIAFLQVLKNCKFIKYLLPLEFVEKYKLKNGDRVIAEMNSDNGQIKIKDVSNINGIPKNKYNGEFLDYYSIGHIESKDIIDFKNPNFTKMNLHKGENIYLYGKDPNENSKIVINMLNTAQVDRAIYINIALIEKTRHIVDELQNCEQFIANLTDDANIVREVLDLAIDRIKRIFEVGEGVVVVIDDMASILNMDKDMAYIKKFLSLAKANGNSFVTMISLMPNDNSFLSLSKLADRNFDIGE